MASEPSRSSSTDAPGRAPVMVFEKNRTNEAGLWFIVVASIVFGPVLMLSDPGLWGRFAGVVMALGGPILAIMMLLRSVQKVTLTNETIELQYYLGKRVLALAEISDARLRQVTHYANGIKRKIDEIDLYVYPNKRIRLGGTYGGFLKHSTRKLYVELRRRAGLPEQV